MIGVLFFIATVSANLENLKQQIGESCDKNANFRIDSFDVSPWPIARSQMYQIKINGVFLEKEYLNQIYIGTKRDTLSFWHYTYLEIKKDFTKGAVGNFTVNEQGPSDRGSYIGQVTLHRRDFGNFACWQYDYVI
jgi:hypothetical protein